MSTTRVRTVEQAVAAAGLVLGLAVTMAYLTFESLTATLTATLLSWVLVAAALALAVDVVARYGARSWTVLAAVLLGLGALAQAAVKLATVGGIAATLPAPLWGLGFLVALRGVRDEAE